MNIRITHYDPNGTERELFDKPNTIINTSCEHIENWNEWWDSIPKAKCVYYNQTIIKHYL